MGKKMRFLGILLFLSILMAVPVIADWDEWQHSNIASGLYAESDGVWDSYPLLARQIDIGANNIQPLIHDFNENGKPEIIVVQSNTVAFYEIDDVMTFVDSVVLNGTITQQPNIFTSGVDVDVDKLAVIAGNTSYVIRYNFTSAGFYKEFGVEANMVSAISGETCYYSELHSQDYCVWLSNTCRVMRHNISGNVIQFTGQVDGATCLTKVPANNPVLLTGYYGDAHGIAFFAGDFGNDGKHDIIAYDIENNNLRSNWDSDGYLEDANTNNPIYSIIAVVGGLSRITITGHQVASNPNIVSFNNDGSTYRDLDITGNDADIPMGTIFYGNVIKDANFEYCSFAYNPSSPSTRALKCFDIGNGSVMYESTGTSLTVPVDNFTVSVVDINTTTDTYEIIAGNVMVDIYEAAFNAPQWQYTTKKNISDIDSNFFNSITDVDIDGSVDVCTQKDNYLACFMANFTNQPPNMTNYFGRNYDSPICTGTTVTFTAAQCGGSVTVCTDTGCTSEDTPCTYNNDLSVDTERIISDCGIKGNVTVNGTYSLASPSVQCTYENPTTYYTTLYLQDSANPEDYSNSQTITLTAINGTAGIDCNFPVSQNILRPENINISQYSDAEYITQGDLDEATAVLFQQSPLIKFIFVFICTLLLMVYLFQIGVRTPILHITAVWILWLIFALIGLFPYIWLVIFSVVIAGIAAAFFMFGNRTNE